MFPPFAVKILVWASISLFGLRYPAFEVWVRVVVSVALSWFGVASFIKANWPFNHGDSPRAMPS